MHQIGPRRGSCAFNKCSQCNFACAGLQGSLKPALLKIVKQTQKGMTTIVYTTFQSQADEIAGYLYVNGVAASSYHAGKMDQVRRFHKLPTSTSQPC